MGCARACARASHQRFQGHLVELARVQVDLVLRIVAGREVGLRRRRQIVSTVEPAHAEVRLHLVAPANLRQDLLDPCDPGLRVGPGLQVDALMQRVAGAADLADRSGRRCGARSAKRSGCRCQARAWPRDKHRWKEGWKGQAGQRPCRTTISQGRSLCSRIQQAELVRCAAEAVCAHLYTVQAGHAACTARCWRTRLLAPLSWTISESPSQAFPPSPMGVMRRVPTSSPPTPLLAPAHAGGRRTPVPLQCRIGYGTTEGALLPYIHASG